MAHILYTEQVKKVKELKELHPKSGNCEPLFLWQGQVCQQKDAIRYLPSAIALIEAPLDFCFLCALLQAALAYLVMSEIACAIASGMCFALA